MRRLSESESVAASLRGLRGTASSQRRRTSRRISSSPSCVDGVGGVARHLVARRLVVEQVGARGGVPSGASPLFCFWRGYGLWVMGYVLCLTHNLYPLSRFPFPILHPSGRPSACPSPLAVVGGLSAAGWDSRAVRGSSQSRSQSRSQSPEPLRRGSAVSRAVSRAVSLTLARGAARRRASPPIESYGTPRRH